MSSDMRLSSGSQFGLAQTVDQLSQIDSSIRSSKSSTASPTEALKFTSETQEKLTNVINDLGVQLINTKKEISSLKVQISQIKSPFKSIKSKSLKKQVVKLQKHAEALGNAQGYAISLQKNIESQTAASVRGLHAEDVRGNEDTQQLPVSDLMKKQSELSRNLRTDLESKLSKYGGGELSGEDLSDLIGKLEKEVVTNPQNHEAKELLTLAKNLSALTDLPEIAAKFARSTDSRNITPEDLNHLQRACEYLDSLKGTDQSKETEQLYELVLDMAMEACGSFEKGMNLLAKLDLKGEAASMLKDLAEGGVPKDDAQKLQWFEKASELYWSFNDPFEPHIGMEGFAQTLLDALDGKESAFSDVVSRMSPEERSEFQEKAELLKKCAPQIKNIATETQYKEIRDNPKLRKGVIQAKAQFLKGKRAESLAANSKPVNVNIIGGGPGGLMRTLIAGVKGDSAKVIEMRDTYTRNNMVKLSETTAMKYFGVKERLAEKGVIDPSKSSIEVRLKDLEEVFTEIAKEIYGNDEFRVTGQVVDILPGADGKANCVIQEGGRQGPKKTTLLPADLVVDSTGARADVSKMLHVNTEQFAESQMMIALVMNDANTGKGSAQGFEFAASIPLSAPGQNYSLIQPSMENQETIRSLSEQKGALWKAETQLQSSISKFETSGFPELHRGNIEARLPAETVHDLKQQYGDGQQYDQELIAAAKQHVLDLQSERKGIEGELEDLLYKIASEQQGKSLTKADVIQVAPFNIELHQREEPAVVHGSSLVMFSGDSLATPDPKSGAGAGHALAGGTVFSKVLDGQRSGSTPEQMKARFDHGSRMQMDQVTAHGISARKQIQDQNPGLTPAYILREAGKMGFLSEKEVNFLHLMHAKISHGGIIDRSQNGTSGELSELEDIEKKVAKMNGMGSQQKSVLEGLNALIVKIKS